MDLKTGKPVFDAYQIITYGETKVAYVGIDTPEAISKSTPTYFQDKDGNYEHREELARVEFASGVFFELGERGGVLGFLRIGLLR